MLWLMLQIRWYGPDFFNRKKFRKKFFLRLSKTKVVEKPKLQSFPKMYEHV